VLSGLIAASIYGNATYFGVIRVENHSLALLSPMLSIGSALGNDVALLTHYANAPTLISLRMAWC